MKCMVGASQIFIVYHLSKHHIKYCIHQTNIVKTYIVRKSTLCLINSVNIRSDLIFVSYIDATNIFLCLILNNKNIIFFCVITMLYHLYISFKIFLYFYLQIGIISFIYFEFE